MSTEVFNDCRRPFEDAPDARFFYLNSAARAACDRLLSGLDARKGVVLLVGEPGTGKTTLLLRLEQALLAAGHPVVLHRCATTSFDELLEACCDKLRVPETANNRMGRVRTLAAHLLERLEAGTTAVILVDDAQTLSDGTLEDLSRLTELEIEGRKLVQVVLAGRTELVSRLRGSNLSILQESAISYCELEPLDRGEVESYIRHRLQAAEGWKPDVFSSEAIERIARYAQGSPRLVNRICATAQQLAARESGSAVSAITIETAVRDLSARSEFAPLAEAPRDGQFVEDAPRDQAAIPVSAAAAEASDEATPGESSTPVEAPPAPASNDRGPERPEGVLDATGEAAPEIADEPPVSGEAESEPSLAPFPSDLVVPLADARPARRRDVAAPIAALFLAGLVLGGLGIAVHELWPLPSNETLSRPLLSDAADEEREALGKDAAAAVAAVPEVRPLAEATADRESLGEAPEVRPLAETTADPATPPGASEVRPLAKTTADPATTDQAPDAQPPAVSAPTLYAAQVRGGEDEAIPLDIRARLPDNGTAGALTIAIAGLPDGTRLSAGRDGGDGRWSLNPDELVGLAVMPPPNFAGPLRLEIEASARGAAGMSANTRGFLAVEVAAKADAPHLDVAGAKGNQDRAIPLEIRAAPADTDGSESLSVTVSGLPQGAHLSTGLHDDDDGWTLRPDELAGLTLTPPPGFNGRFEILVAATAREANGDSRSTKALLPVEVARAPVAFTGARGGFVIQLAALRSAADARREATRLKDRFPELLGNARLKVYEADVNGVPYFRVRTEAVPDKAEVFQTCERLKSNQQDCMVLQQIAAAKPIAAPTNGAPAGTAPISLLPREVTIAMVEAGTPASMAKLNERNIAVRDFVMARDVVDREPVGVTTTFSPQDGRAFAYAKVDNPGAPTHVSFMWLYDDALYATIDMEVGTSVRWRTWSSAELSLGAWRVQIVSADGEVLAENAFTVE